MAGTSRRHAHSTGEPGVRRDRRPAYSMGPKKHERAGALASKGSLNEDPNKRTKREYEERYGKLELK